MAVQSHGIWFALTKQIGLSGQVDSEVPDVKPSVMPGPCPGMCVHPSDDVPRKTCSCINFAGRKYRYLKSHWTPNEIQGTPVLCDITVGCGCTHQCQRVRHSSPKDQKYIFFLTFRAIYQSR